MSKFLPFLLLALPLLAVAPDTHHAPWPADNAAAGMRVPPGFCVTLFAAEPVPVEAVIAS